MAPAPIRHAEPVSNGELYTVVQGLASQDYRVIQTSEKRFKAMLDMFGTYDALNAIATSRNLPLAIRQQSIIQFKNAALSHWKSKRLLSDDQRILIRERTLGLLDEEDEIIASCNKFIIGKLARQDYPSAWPSLLPDLINVITAQTNSFISSGGNDAGSVLLLKRSLGILNSILKELGTVKMPSGLKTMAKIVDDIHMVLQEQYGALSANIPAVCTPASFASKQAADTMQLSHLIYKCISKAACWLWHRLTVHNNKMDHLEPWMISFFGASATQFRALTEMRTNLFVALSGPPFHITPGRPPVDGNASRTLDFLMKHIRHLGKLFRRLQQLATAKFVSLPACSELVLYGWSKVVQATEGSPTMINDSHLAIYPLRFLVQCMALFRESLAQWTPSKQGPSALSKSFVEGAVQVLVTRFIPLKVTDLESWSSDPEEWFNAEDKENDQWEYELRPCAERVLLTLINQYQDIVAPLLAVTFKQVTSQPTTGLENVLQKEAIYCAVGRCALRLKDVVPFEQWIAVTLPSEVRSTDASFPILKRRIAWVIGKVVSECCVSATNSIVWEILVHLLSDRNTGSDAVVRFSAAAAVRECVDTLDFNPNVFLPHLATAVYQLVFLVAEADTVEAKRRVTQSLNVVIERMGTQITPHMEVIAKPLPELWSSAGDNYLFKGALLETVTKLIESTKEASVSLNPITVPLIRESFSEEGRLQLDEDGLILWQAALRNAATVENVTGGPSLFELVPMAIVLLANNLDLLRSITNIVKSYVVLDCSRLLQAHGVDLFCAFKKALGAAVSVNVKDMLITLQLLVQVAPSQLWAEPMHVSELFATIINPLDDDKTAVSVLTEEILLFARMAMTDSSAFVQLMSATASSLGKPESALWKDVLDQWWQRFDSLSDPRSRKLTAMGIANLVATGRPDVLDRLDGEIFNLWLDVFAEMKEALVELSEEKDVEDSTLSPLIMFWKHGSVSLPDSVDEIQGTLEYARYQEIYKRDPVETAKLTTYVSERLNYAQQVCGGPQAFESQWLAKSDPTVIKQLKSELIS